MQDIRRQAGLDAAYNFSAQVRETRVYMPESQGIRSGCRGLKSCRSLRQFRGTLVQTHQLNPLATPLGSVLLSVFLGFRLG